MFALTYYSKAVYPFNDASLYNLLTEAQSNNERSSVTGFLQYKNNHFLQYLEGSEVSVLDLMKKIDQDTRHTVLRQVSLKEFTDRRFDNWHMRYWKENEFKYFMLSDLLRDVLRVISPDHFGEEYLEERITRLVDRMSEHQHQAHEFRQSKI